MNKEHLMSILSAGNLGPSADNSQPWFFEVAGDSVLLFHDRANAHANHIYNIDYFADFVSLGMVLQNIALQADELGYAATTRLLEHTGTGPLAEIHLEHTRARKSDRLHPLIGRRHTNRRAYATTPLHPDLKKNLAGIAARNGAHIFWVDAPREISDFARVIAAHDAVLWEDEMLRKNLLRMLRFGNAAHADGLSLESLELGFKRHFFKPSIFAAKFFPVLWRALGFGSIRHARNHIRHSGHLALLTVPKARHPHTYIQGGQAFQSVWLELAKNAIAVQPLFGPLAFLLNGQLGKGGLSKKHEKIRKDIEEHFLKYFPALKDETAVAFFRVGYAENPSAVAGRKNIQEVVRDIS